MIDKSKECDNTSYLQLNCHEKNKGFNIKLIFNVRKINKNYYFSRNNSIQTK